MSADRPGICPACGDIALDGHITCGRAACNEGEWRRRRADEYATAAAGESSSNEFSVVQFFEDGQYEYVRRYVTAKEALLAARHYCTSVGARMGVVARVIITDGGDCTCFEWKRGEGVTYPPEWRKT